MTNLDPQHFGDQFIQAIVDERIDDVIAGYDPSDETYVFLEGPRWSTKTGERVATGWKAFNASPIRMRGWSWVEGPFCMAEGSMGWVAGIVDLRVGLIDPAGGLEREVNVRLRGTYVVRRQPDGRWAVIHEHFSQPMDDPYGVGDWLPKPSP